MKPEKILSVLERVRVVSFELTNNNKFLEVVNGCGNYFWKLDKKGATKFISELQELLNEMED